MDLISYIKTANNGISLENYKQRLIDIVNGRKPFDLDCLKSNEMSLLVAQHTQNTTIETIYKQNMPLINERQKLKDKLLEAESHLRDICMKNVSIAHSLQNAKTEQAVDDVWQAHSQFREKTDVVVRTLDNEISSLYAKIGELQSK